MKPVKLSFAVALATLSLAACDNDDDKDNSAPAVVANVFSGSGDIATPLAAFKAAAGDPLNNTPNKTSGRREVNWDGVPAAVVDNNPFPVDFFNATAATDPDGRKRGVLLNNGAPTTAFRTSTKNFSDINASYATQFAPFSNDKTFAYLGSNVTDVTFRIAGTNTEATTAAFGVIFSDVDDPNSTKVEFFNGDKSLGVFAVPARSGNTSFSFLGVAFPSEKITRAKITVGNGTLGPNVQDMSNGGNLDLVVMDDFIYSEPLAR